MNHLNNRTLLNPLFFFFLLLVLSPLIVTLVRGGGDVGIDNGNILNHKEEKKGEGDDDKQDPSFVERAIGITGLNSHWDQFQAWAKLAWMNLQPPDARFGQSGSNADVVKQAATRSFETSKEAVQQTAATAAKVAGKAMEKTTEKLKKTLSSDQREIDAEL